MGKIIERNFMYNGHLSVAKIISTAFVAPAVLFALIFCGFGFVLAAVTQEMCKGNSNEDDTVIAMIAAFVTGTALQLIVVAYLAS